MHTPTVILITGHPASGKTTLAHYLARRLSLPLIWKDQFKESLLKTLGSFTREWSTKEWSGKLSVAAWALLYLQVENLLQARVSHIVEANFDPLYANARWQKLNQSYEFHLIQVRCKTEAGTLLKRYRRRIEEGRRHRGHIDDSRDKAFLESIRQPMEWVMVESERLSFDTTEIVPVRYVKIAEDLQALMEPGRPAASSDAPGNSPCSQDGS